MLVSAIPAALAYSIYFSRRFSPKIIQIFTLLWNVLSVFLFIMVVNRPGNIYICIF